MRMLCVSVCACFCLCLCPSVSVSVSVSVFMSVCAWPVSVPACVCVHLYLSVPVPVSVSVFIFSFPFRNLLKCIIQTCYSFCVDQTDAATKQIAQLMKYEKGISSACSVFQTNSFQFCFCHYLFKIFNFFCFY